MANVELVSQPADGSGPSGQFHAAELVNIIRGINGAGVVGHTLTATITETSLVVTLPAITAYVPNGSGVMVEVSYAGGTVTHDAADATNPRIDIITLDSAGNAEIGKGTATAEVDAVIHNSGTGTINSGATSATVTHGLTSAPALDDIFITLGENPTNTPGAIWVDTITATQFNVNCENDPGASNLDFAWQAQVVTSAPQEAPMPSLDADEIMLAKVKIRAAVTAIATTDIYGRAVDISDRQLFPPGTEALPGISFVGDTNTGIRRSAADTMELVTAGADRWQVTSAGHLLAVDDDTYDIGASGATRPRTIYIAGSLIISTDVSLSRGAANRLDLASGDSLNLVSGQLQFANGDVILDRASANLLQLASGDSFNIIDGTFTVGSAAAGNSTSFINAATGGQAQMMFNENGVNRNMWYYNGTSNIFACWTTDSDGGGTDADVIRIPDGQLTVDGNATFDDSAFDYVCASCGRHEADMFECCGEVSWHDDVELMHLVTRPERAQALMRMERLGLMRRYDDGQMFVSLNRMPFYLMSGMAQLWERVNRLEERVA